MSTPQSYLALCQTLAQEAEITQQSGVPGAVTGQVGQLMRVCNWVRDAYKEIQNRHANWRWLKKPFNFTTIANQDAYAYTSINDQLLIGGSQITRFKRWLLNDPKDPPMVYLLSAGVSTQFPLTWLDFDQFKWLFRRGTQSPASPVYISVDDADQICIGPKPPAALSVVTGFYQRGNQELTADGDVPEMPADYHDLIWKRAIQKYAANSVAPEIYTRCNLEANSTMRALEREQRGGIRLGKALA